jgi:ATPase subunit of ABC transporter with duplicated ATPase domains
LKENVKEVTNVRIKESVADALKVNYLENDEDFEFESMDDVITYLIDRDAILQELQNDSDIQERVEDIERNWRIAELEEELAALKGEAAESQKKSARAQVVTA